ncbi:MAG: hypothetical protein PVI21_00760 [Candidatus Woesebacteria bacterium]
MTKQMSSILDGYPVPPEFDKYCLKLISTKEIDSVKKLKDFWLYAIEVGKEYGPEYRDAIADWAIYIAHFATKIPGIKAVGATKNANLSVAYLMLHSYCPFTPGASTSDEVWTQIEGVVKGIETNKMALHQKIYFDTAPQRFLKRYFRR